MQSFCLRSNRIDCPLGRRKRHQARQCDKVFNAASPDPKTPKRRSSGLRGGPLEDPRLARLDGRSLYKWEESEVVKIIAMLTNNDLTIENARDLFEESHHAPTQYWGFKDTGISSYAAGELAKYIYDKGKTIVFESFGVKEDDCQRAAEFAVKNKCKYLIGCEFHASVVSILQGSSVSYRPTIGRRAGVPRYLYGSIEDVVGDGQRVLASGADGICLSMYR